jgi:hypothetical protein
MTHVMNQLSPTSELYSEALAEEERRVQIEKPTLGYQKHQEVMTIERPHKSHRRESMVVEFSDEDYAGVSLPHTDAIKVMLQVANHRIH